MEAVGLCLHSDVIFADPQEKIIGKEAVLKAAKGFSGMFKTLTIHAKFGSESQAVVVYDLEIPGYEKKLRAASLLSFQGDLISQIELIYDSRFLMEKKAVASST